MSGSLYCDICHRWYYITYASHNERHLRENPHTFCRTMNCGQKGCPVKDVDKGAKV